MSWQQILHNAIEKSKTEGLKKYEPRNGDPINGPDLSGRLDRAILLPNPVVTPEECDQVLAELQFLAQHPCQEAVLVIGDDDAVAFWHKHSHE